MTVLAKVLTPATRLNRMARIAKKATNVFSAMVEKLERANAELFALENECDEKIEGLMATKEQVKGAFSKNVKVIDHIKTLLGE